MGCNIDEEPSPFADIDVFVNQIGDSDGFGFGIEDATWRSNSEGFFDFRMDDPFFTDIFPAIRNGLPIEYIHTIDIEEGSSIINATLVFRTFSLQDGDPGEVGLSSDLRLFLDGIEIIGAFDEVDQFYIINGERGSIAGSEAIKIPSELYGELLDGVLNVKLELSQQGDGVYLMDAFAIDFSHLRIESVLE